MSYKTIIDSRVCGIPCQIGVVSYLNVPGSYSHNAASDVDYYGYSECEFDVLDRRGRHAPWLERKLDGRDREQIECEIGEHFRSLRYDA